MRKTLLLFILLLSIYSSAQTNSNTNSNLNIHPSLLIQSGDEPRMKQSVKNSPELTVIQDIIFKESDNILKLPCLKKNCSMGDNQCNSMRYFVSLINSRCSFSAITVAL